MICWTPFPKVDGTQQGASTQQAASGDFSSVTIDGRLLGFFLSGCTQVLSIRHLLLGEWSSGPGMGSTNLTTPSPP